MVVNKDVVEEITWFACSVYGCQTLKKLILSISYLVNDFPVAEVVFYIWKGFFPRFVMTQWYAFYKQNGVKGC